MLNCCMEYETSVIPVLFGSKFLNVDVKVKRCMGQETIVV